jgi:hypothetical protein
MRNANKILAGLREWNGPLGGLGEDNIKINLKETGCEVLDKIQLAQDRVQRRVINFGFHQRLKYLDHQLLKKECVP